MMSNSSYPWIQLCLWYALQYNCRIPRPQCSSRQTVVFLVHRISSKSCHNLKFCHPRNVAACFCLLTPTNIALKNALACQRVDSYTRVCTHIIYMNVTVHGKTNHIALGLSRRYEPNKLPMVIIIDFDFLS